MYLRNWLLVGVGALTNPFLRDFGGVHTTHRSDFPERLTHVLYLEPWRMTPPENPQPSGFVAPGDMPWPYGRTRCPFPPCIARIATHLVDPQHAPDKRGRSYRTLVKIDKFQTVDES